MHGEKDPSFKRTLGLTVGALGVVFGDIGTSPLYAIHEYHTEVEKLIHYGGTNNEMSVRNAFSRLLDYYAHSRDLKLVPEVSIKTKAGKIVQTVSSNVPWFIYL